MFRYFKCHILWYLMVVKYDGSTDRCGSIECCECFFFFDDKNGKEKISISHLEERNIIIINIVNISDKYI